MSKKLNSNTYSLHQFDNKAVLRHPSGSYVEDASKLRSAAYALLETANSLDEKRRLDASYMVADYKSEVAWNYIESILQQETVVWLFDSEAIQQVSTQGYPFVYFAESQTDYKGAIKIGYTWQPLETRMKQIQDELKMASPPVPLAVIMFKSQDKTANELCHSLEYWLHTAFTKDKVVSEWFNAVSVKWFIHHYKHISIERKSDYDNTSSMQETF